MQCFLVLYSLKWKARVKLDPADSTLYNFPDALRLTALISKIFAG